MKFSEQWLRSWSNPALDSNELAEKLSLSGLEVDGLEPAAADFQGVVVAEILACERHPDADKLQVCQVSTGSETVQIVCGAPNARAGLKAPLAVVGAELPGDFRIKKARLRGVESFGMLCSARELGLSEDHAGLMELPEDAPVGEDLRAYLQLDDTLIDVDLTPNRADCLSIAGMAREVAALTNCPLQPPAMQTVPVESQARFEVELQSPEDCPIYLGRVIEGLDLSAQTPLWMQERLRRSGIRAIAPAVDVTNYVMLELGQPLHAFDLDRLQGRIIVRRAQADEQLVLLDGKTVTLNEEYLLIADEEKPLAIAGIMGGEHSGVNEQTTRVFLECAWFKPARIMGKARDLGLHTESSHRYERGVDPQLQQRAIERATELLLAIAGGQAGPVVAAVDEAHVPAQPRVRLRKARLARILGTELEDETVTAIFQRLGFAPETDSDGWTVTAPSWRVDIAIEEDLVEEVARVHGYNQLPTRAPGGRLRMDPVSEYRVQDRVIRQLLVDLGYQECINYSFIPAKEVAALDHESLGIALANPLSEDMAVMRTSLLPGLMNTLDANRKRKQERVRLFETGACFLRGAAEEQPLRLGMLLAGPAEPENWANSQRPADFFDLKGDVERLLTLSRGTWKIIAPEQPEPWLHPGKCAHITRDGQVVGWLGALHPAYQQRWKLKGEVLAMEVALAALRQTAPPKYQPASPYPSIRRDLALLVPQGVQWQRVEEAIWALAGETLRQVQIFDLYTGENIEKGCTSIAIGLILQEDSRTLLDEDADRIVQEVVAGLQQQFQITLRS